MKEGFGPLAPYLELRERLVAGWFPGADAALAGALTEAVSALADPLPPDTAVVAVGGLGRGSMALRSDADVWILHRGRPVEELAARIFRPLWDVGLRVGHGFHTPASARALAGARLDAFCTLLTARVLAGDPTLFDEVSAGLTRLIDKEYGRLLDGLAAEERERRRREPYLEMAADLKTSRGGIRTLDMLDWRRRIGAVVGLPALGPTPVEAEVRATLLEVRSALHAAAGRAHDRFDFELRPAAAAWARTDVRRLGRRLVAARVAAEDLVEAAWEDRLREPARPVPAPDAPALRRVVAALRRPGADLGALPVPHPPLAVSDRGCLLGIVEDHPSLRRLAASGWLAEVLPRLAALRTEPHVVAFHRYAVFDHLLATVDELRRLERGDPSVPLLAEILPELGELDLVAWAALFHDLGKGVDGDHSRAGAELVRAEVEGFGFSPVELDDLSRLVELHLLLPDLATRFDVDHPGVVAWAADRISDLATLRRLYLLTVADSRATGSDTWSGWRADLVLRAYRRLERELTRRSLAEPVQLDVLVDQVVAAGAADRSAVVAHLSGLPASYRSAHTPAEIASHVRLGALPLGPEMVRIEVTEGLEAAGEVTWLVLTCPDRRGLLTTVAGTMALHRFSVLDARIATRSDGRVFDTFAVVDALGGGPVTAGSLAAFERDLGRAVRGGFDVEGALAAKQHAYRHIRREGVAPAVSVRPLPTGGGVVEVEGADRLGLLHDLARVVSAHGMEIVRARVDTRAGVAYDLFTVERLPSDATTFETDLLSVL